MNKKKQQQTRQQGTTGTRSNRLRIARETVKSLSKDELRQVAGGVKAVLGSNDPWQEC